jgi:hypothetical protein
MGTWFHTVGQNEEVHPEKGEEFSLEEIQKYVGGYFTPYLTFEDGSMLPVHEDAGFDPHALVNMGAWIFAARKRRCRIVELDPILGDALYCLKGEIS